MPTLVVGCVLIGGKKEREREMMLSKFYTPERERERETGEVLLPPAGWKGPKKEENDG